MEAFRERVRQWVERHLPQLQRRVETNANEARSRKVFFLHQLPPGCEQPSDKINNAISSNKYTVLTFLPLNLYEQFHRVANFYFLGIFIMQILIESPVSPYTSGLPLLFVVGLTAIKQAYEDYCRYREDKKENAKPVYIVRSGVLVKDQCQNIRPGDIVRVRGGDTIPADLVIISSNYDAGNAFYSTAALDGESNLKKAISLPKTQPFSTPAEITQIRCYCEVQAPNPELSRFAGRAVFNYGVGGENEEISPLTPDQLIMRGSILRNTEWIYGLAVYTGSETKMVQNWKNKRQKRSITEHCMNKFLVFYITVLFGMSFFSLMMESIWTFGDGGEWYRSELEPKSPGATLVTFFSFLVIYNYVIPISLYVTVEMNRFISAFFITWDDHFHYRLADGEELQAKVNCSDINDELGQINYVLSDKTGTLTENEMNFKACSINGVVFRKENKLLVREDGKEVLPHHDAGVYQFFLALSLCHTVEAKVAKSFVSPTSEPHSQSTLSPGHLDINYTASSPDELALVEAAKDLGVAFIGGEGNEVKVQTCTKNRQFKVEEVIEFTSARKRMSIILRDENDNFLLLTKGAESHVLPLVTKGPVETIRKQVTQFSMQGYRTLVVCKRLISKNDGNRLIEEIRQAKAIVNNQERFEKLEIVYAKAEQGLELIGITAVEDRLQDDVTATMESLRLAGIVIWILTGDNEETAVAVSRMARHFDEKTRIVRIGGENSDEIGHAITEAIKTIQPGAELGAPLRNNPGKGWGVIIPGHVISVANRDHRKLFEMLLLKIKPECVICCRMAPIQKAEVVKMVRNGPDSPITLAVGDGANDVSMIQEAHVGVGLFGKEGRAAARNADYALPRFCHLQRLCLYHGRMFYKRLAVLVQYFFFKNLVYVIPQFYYQFRCLFSQLTLYDGAYLTLYNTLFTAFPILFYSILDQDLPAESIIRKPFIYKDIARNQLLKFRSFVRWTGEGLAFGTLVYYFMSNYYHTTEKGGPHDFGIACYTTIVLVVTLRLIIEKAYWTWLSHVAIWGTLAIYGIFGLVYSSTIWQFMGAHGADLYWIVQHQWSSPIEWLVLPLIVTSCSLPIIAWKVFSNELAPTETHLEHCQVNIRSSKNAYSASPCVQLNRFIRWWQRYRYGDDAQPLPVHQSQSYSSITTTTAVNPVTNI